MLAVDNAPRIIEGIYTHKCVDTSSVYTARLFMISLKLGYVTRANDNPVKNSGCKGDPNNTLLAQIAEKQAIDAVHIPAAKYENA